ncbi:MAG: hypothetical protein F6K16_36795, partial [Symploca sp. SIO2B6]|nr:hypothetical protein [Symploca sp. SIO2B6]
SPSELPSGSLSDISQATSPSHLDTHWQIQQHQLRALLNLENSESDQPDIVNTVIIDTREPREYEGQTPYGEQRGGHVPGAVNLYFKDFLDESGYLKPQSEALTLVKQHGITPDTSIVAYCTGGIRSAWLTVVLTHYGFQIRNYPGYMWEWSAAPAHQYPLATP